ncbi:MAG: hypothetical protein AB1728_10805 [Bacteroidota bacterium]
MNNNELNRLLIDYAEGTLDETGRKRVEQELKKSHQLRTDLDILRSTLDHLQHQDEENVPSHYFSNFLPRLRERLDEKRVFNRFTIPLWLQKIAVPVSTTVIIFSMIGLYNLLMPDTSLQVLSSIVRETEQADVEQMIANSTPIGITITSVPTSTIDSQVIAEELLVSASLFDYVVSDSQILSQLDEQDVELIVQRLVTGSIQ